MAEPDRVNYTFGLKLNMGNYESCMVNMSYSSDVKKGETLKKAMARVSEFVEEEIDKKREELKGEDGDD